MRFGAYCVLCSCCPAGCLLCSQDVCNLWSPAATLALLRLALKLLCSPAPQLVNNVSMAAPSLARLPGGASRVPARGTKAGERPQHLQLQVRSGLPQRGGGRGVLAGTCVRKGCRRAVRVLFESRLIEFVSDTGGKQCPGKPRRRDR